MSANDYQLNKKYLARHKLIDFYGCNPMKLNFAKYLEPIMLDATQKAHCKIIGIKSHQFNPIGASVVVLVAESHFSIHTWPEQNKALVDIFASGDVDLNAAIEFISKSLEATSSKIIDIERG